MAYNSTLTFERLSALQGHDVFGVNGVKLGTLENIYVDDSSGSPEWLEVQSGMIRKHHSFVPVNGLVEQDETVRVAYPKEVIDEAPSPQSDGAGRLSAEQEDALSRYYAPYGFHPPVTMSGQVAGGPEVESEAPVVGGVPADGAMTRSEEQLSVSTATREAGRAHLRKSVETEHVSGSVPTRHEGVHLEREPITDQNVDQAMAGPALSDADHEEILFEEVPVVEKTVVPKERVRMVKDETVRSDVVDADVRKERIDTDGDVGGTRQGD